MERNDFFHGRDALIQQVYTVLTSGGSAYSIRKCVLSGLGGSGKTQTALEYAYRYRSKYDFIFWVDAEVESKLIQDFVDITSVLPNTTTDTDDKASVKRAKIWLSTTRELTVVPIIVIMNFILNDYW